MTKLLTQNAKMKRSSELVFNFGIPAFKSVTGLKTCPNAGKCAAGCYAKSGAYAWSNVQQAYENRLAATLRDDFEEVMVAAIESKLRNAKRRVVIRVHDSGDFYSEEYAKKWRNIAWYFSEENVYFYAYTKQVKMMKAMQKWPPNFRLIYSFGGKQDHLIDVENDFHSVVFEDFYTLEQNGYVDSSHDDMVAAFCITKRIGLIYHGARKYINTLWSEVKTV